MRKSGEVIGRRTRGKLAKYVHAKKWNKRLNGIGMECAIKDRLIFASGWDTRTSARRYEHWLSRIVNLGMIFLRVGSEHILI